MHADVRLELDGVESKAGGPDAGAVVGARAGATAAVVVVGRPAGHGGSGRTRLLARESIDSAHMKVMRRAVEKALYRPPFAQFS